MYYIDNKFFYKQLKSIGSYKRSDKLECVLEKINVNY